MCPVGQCAARSTATPSGSLLRAMSLACVMAAMAIASDARAQSRYAGTWFDQDKLHDGGLWTLNYYQDVNGNGRYDLGETVSDILAADANHRTVQDPWEDWGNWKIAADNSCWAATAANLMQCVGAPNYYNQWMFESGVEGLNWTDSGSPRVPLENTGYRVAVAAAYEDETWSNWEQDVRPLAGCMNLLAMGMPVGLRVKWNSDSAHWFTAYGMTNNTITFVHSDADGNGVDYVTRPQRFQDDKWQIDWDGDGTYNSITHWVSYDVLTWKGSGTGGNAQTSQYETSTQWEDSGNWTGPPGTGGPPGNDICAYVHFANPGRINLSSHTSFLKLTLDGQNTELMTQAGAYIYGGALQVSGGASLYANDTTVQVRGDLISDGGIFFTNVTSAAGSMRVGVNRAGQITQSGGTVGGPELLMGIWPEGSGYYSMLDGANTMFQAVQVGLQGSGQFDHVSGAMAAREIKLGIEAASTGNYDIYGGNLDADIVVVGDRGEGHFTQHGGQVHVVDIMYVAAQAAGEGRYDISGGSLAVDRLRVGYGGQGQMTQNGGSVNVQTVRVGCDANSSGTYALSGGGVLTANEVFVGWAGIGTLTQSGGAVMVNQAIHLGYDAGGAGWYHLSGAGMLSATDLYVGEGGSGTVMQSGGMASFTDAIHIAGPAGSSGRYELTGSGALSAWNLFVGDHGEGSLWQSDNSSLIVDYLGVAQSVGSQGDATVHSGTLTARTVQVGVGGRGSMTQDSGTLSVRTELSLGAEHGSFGTYVMSGGTVSAQTITAGRLGDGRFYHYDGNVSVLGDLTMGAEGGSYGLYEIHGGLLDVRDGAIDLAEPGYGILDIRGGTVIADAIEGGDLRRVQTTGGVLRVNGCDHDAGTDVAFGSALQLGHSGGRGSALYNLGFGSLTAPTIVAGYDASGTIVLGDNTATLRADAVVLGEVLGAIGRLELTRGQIEANTVIIGRGGYGCLVHARTGAALEAKAVVLGEQPGGEGLYELQYSLLADTLDIGLGGRGELYQSNGYVHVPRIRLGVSAGSLGVLTVTDDALVSGQQDSTIEVGGLGEGILKILGGQVDTEELVFGPSGSLQSQGTAGVLSVGQITNRPADFIMNGKLSLGYARRAPFNVGSGQTVYAGVLELTAGDVLVEGTGVLTAGMFSVTSDIQTSLTIRNGGTLVADRFWLPSSSLFTGGAGSTLRINSFWFGDDANLATAGNLQLGHARGTGFSGITVAAGRSIIAGGTLTIGYDGEANFIQEGTVAAPYTEVGREAGGYGVYSHVAGEHSTGVLSIGVLHDSYGAYNLGGSYETLVSTADTIVGDGGIGVFNQTEGTLQLSHFLYVGHDAGGSGTYNLTSGTIDAWSGSIVVGASGAGTMTQSGGSAYASQLIVGQSDGSAGVYAFTDGVLSASTTIVGEQGDGAFTLDGAMNWHQCMTSLQIGHGADSNGYYSLTGGRVWAGTMSVGDAGRGSMYQAGGQVQTMNDLNIAAQSGSRGYYRLSNGGQVSAMMLNVGPGGSGLFDHRGGDVSVMMDMRIGGAADSNGTYEIRDGTLSVNGTLSLGDGGPGRLSMIGSLLGDGTSRSVMTNTLRFGASGVLETTGAGNTLVVNQIENMPDVFGFAGVFGVGYMGGWGSRTVALSGSQQLSASVVSTGYNAEGTISVADSSLLTTNALDVGFGNWSTGHIAQSGGTVNVLAELLLGYEWASGDYALSGGSLVADSAAMRVGNGGTGSFTITGGTATVGHIDVGSAGAGTGRFALSGGLVVTDAFNLGASGEFISDSNAAELRTNALSFAGDSFATLGTLSIGHGGLSGSGSFTLQAGKGLASRYLNVGYNGQGQFVQDGGTNTVGATLRLGSEAGGTGSYELDGGSVASATSTIGRNGAGSFVQSSGTHTISDYLYLGYATGARGVYDLSGDGVVSTRYEYVGYDGNAAFTQSGGVHNATSIYMALGAGSRARYDLSGGDLLASGLYVGSWGKANFAQTEGNSAPRNALYLGDNANSEGNYDLTGGKLNSTIEYIGRAGTGRFTHSGGTNTASTMYFGYTAGGSGTYELSGAGMLSVTSTLYVGYNASGTFTQSGGQAQVAAAYVGQNLNVAGVYQYQGGALSITDLIVAHRGRGTFVQSGSDLAVTRLKLADHADGNGRYELSGGTLTASQYERVGDLGRGTFYHSGGTNSTPSLTIGGNAGAIGVYTIIDGTLAVSGGTITLGGAGGGSGTLNLQGGAVIANLLSRNAGGTLNATSPSCVLQVNGVSGFTTLSTPGAMYLGYVGGSGSGSYSLGGGQSLAVGQSLMVGYTAPATFAQTGGTAALGGLYVGGLAGGNGTYEISGGTLDARNGTIEVGITGSGALDLNGGTVIAQELRIDNQGALNSNGIFGILRVNELNNVHTNDLTLAGKLQIGHSGGRGAGGFGVDRGQTLSVHDLTVGYDAAGLLVQSGGSVNAAGYVFLGDESGSRGTYTMHGGTLTANGLGIGGLGANTAVGEFNMDGGSLTVTRMYLADDSEFSILDATSDIILAPGDASAITFFNGASFNAVSGSTIHMAGSEFANFSTNPADLAGLSNLTMIFEGGLGQIDPFEIGGRDIGCDVAGFTLNFTLDTLQLGGANSGYVQLVDAADNTPGWAGPEALYVENLFLGEGSTLDLNGYNLYTLNYTDDGGTVLNGHITQLPEPGTIALLAIGLATMGLRRRMIRRKNGD